MIKYTTPQNWLNYRLTELVGVLTEAKAAVISLVTMPYQRSWVEKLQTIQLKREVAGTSKIEGAEFTDREFEAAINRTPADLLTRSQKQAHAAMMAYRWISNLPSEMPINTTLIKEIHALIIGDADSDHCPPGRIRGRDINVTFGIPPHRGCEGGADCERAFEELGAALNSDFLPHDRLIQALALHFHFAAMHPFLDGNGRTARAVEALMLQRAGLTDHLFIAMSNYYYDEKINYLSALSSVSPPNYDLTSFLIFGLKGIKIQCDRLFAEIQVNVKRSIFINTMYELFDCLSGPRTRVMKDRHIAILKLLLEVEELPIKEVFRKSKSIYRSMKSANKAFVRDVVHLLDLEAIKIHHDDREGAPGRVSANLDWPKTITENGFMKKVKAFPKVKSTIRIE